MAKKKRLQMQKRKADSDQIMKHMLNPKPAKVKASDDELYPMVQALYKAHEDNDATRFEELKSELEDRGCVVRFKDDGDLSVLMPQQGFGIFGDDED